MSRKLIFGIFLLGAFMCVGQAKAQGVGEHVDRFDSVIVVEPNEFRVVETIQYAFGPGSHHGIFRDIPISYPTEFGNKSVTLSNISVTNASTTPYPYTVSNLGRLLEVKIGDPNTLVSGKKTYIISYTIARAYGYFEAYDELYWNITGSEWKVSIFAGSTTIILPHKINVALLKASCYQGTYGSMQPCLSIFGATTTTALVGFATKQPLAVGEGLTVALSFPKEVVRQPTKLENFLQFLYDNPILALPVLVLGLMCALWYTRGRDPSGRGTIVPEYEAPEGLTPLELSTVLHQKAKTNDISSEIVYLATLGYIKITRLEEKGLLMTHTDYQLDRLKSNEGLSILDRYLFVGLFGSKETVKLSDLKNVFYEKVPGIIESASQSVVTKGYFKKNPTSVRTWYFYVGGFAALLFFYLIPYGDLTVTAAGGLSGIIIILFGLIMPRVTKKGAIMREQIKGLKMYMEVAEKDRIDFHNAPQKSPEIFEKLLPFAMILGVEKAWAKQFEGIYNQSPSWYSDPLHSGFRPVLFASDIRSFSTGAASTLASAPSGGSGSGGGGFSGGGFGGGGGGSW